MDSSSGSLSVGGGSEVGFVVLDLSELLSVVGVLQVALRDLLPRSSRGLVPSRMV